MRDDYPTVATKVEAVSAARAALHEAWRAGFVAGSTRPARESWLEWMVRLAKGRGHD